MISRKGFLFLWNFNIRGLSAFWLGSFRVDLFFDVWFGLVYGRWFQVLLRVRCFFW